MENLEKRARRIAQKAEEAAKELSKPKPLISELFGPVGRVELYGRLPNGSERFIAELGPPTNITVQTLPKEPNPNREVLYETRTWNGWGFQIVYYRDTGKAYMFFNHGPHYTARLLGEGEVKALRAALEKARRRLLSTKAQCNASKSTEEDEFKHTAPGKTGENGKED